MRGPRRFPHEQEVRRAVDGSGAGRVDRRDQEVEGDEPEGAPRPDPVEGGRRRTRLDRPSDRRSVRVSQADRRERPPAARGARLPGDARGAQAGDASDREDAQRRAGGPDHRHSPRSAPAGLRPLDPTAAGTQGRGIGDRGVRQPRDGAADDQKNGMTSRKIEYWVIPPEADGEFVAHMEEVPETYARPYDPARPVLCMDEQPVQLLREARVPIPATHRHPKRVDYEYERAGTANIFMFAEPLAGWREVAVRETKTKVDWAVEMASLLEGRYAGADRVVVVCDNLNTHTKGAFYESFAPARARQLVRRIEFCYTPKHGSWLNIAENELSCLTSQGIADRRFGDVPTLRAEATAWSCDLNSICEPTTHR